MMAFVPSESSPSSAGGILCGQKCLITKSSQQEGGQTMQVLIPLTLKSAEILPWRTWSCLSLPVF